MTCSSANIRHFGKKQYPRLQPNATDIDIWCTGCKRMPTAEGATTCRLVAVGGALLVAGAGALAGSDVGLAKPSGAHPPAA